METNPKTTRQAGFALIVTLSLMILLTVIAVGLLTLSSISLRSTSQGSAASTAQTNARLAMMLALGELQTTLGPDQSVSAPASSVIASAPRPQLTGVWQSWHWTPTVGGSPSYTDKATRFREWLVSTGTPSDAKQFVFAAPAAAKAVTLVGNSTTPLSDTQGVPIQVTGEKVKVGSGAQLGKYAWVVFDESIKAPINLGNPTTAQTSGNEIATRTVPNRVHADILDTTNLTALVKPKNLISLNTAVITEGSSKADQYRKRFHDFTTDSVGLLTDTANGGLKTDLTTLFESGASSTMPSGLFTTDTPYPKGFLLASGAPKWAYIRDHYRKYKNTSATSGGEIAYDLKANQGGDLTVINDGTNTGVIPSPETERLLPVIAKFQLVFSLVAHYPFNVDNPTRRKYLDDNGNPKGFTNYGVINLAYDTVVTLYNPYDVTLNLAKTRIRIWDPPVGFSFTKFDHGDPYQATAISQSNFRSDSKFVGMAAMQLANQPRKCFTLVLADGTSQGLNGNLELKPGEVKVFAPRVETGWTWGTETVGGYTSNSQATFFDWDPTKNFGNKDHRRTAIFGSLGVECAPGWNVIAGLQSDNLANSRNSASRYIFEKNAAFVTIRTRDEVMVEAKPLVVTPSGTSAEFQVDVLAGVNEGDNSSNIGSDSSNAGVISDTLRSYRFKFNVISDELSADPAHATITRQFEVGKILQPDTGMQTGWKKAFAMLEMSARTTKESLTDSKPWLYNNFVVDGGIQQTTDVGLTHQSYDLRLIEMSSFNSFPGGISIEANTNRGYFGANASVAEGSSFVPMLHVPVAPTASLGELMPTNMAGGSTLPRTVHPFGNSRAHPLIPSNKVTEGTMMDHSYLLNDALLDSYYFSTFTDYVNGIGGGVMQETKTIKQVLTGVFDGTKPALNNRLVPVAAPDSPTALANIVAGLSDQDRSRQIAKYVAVNGPFNVNSTSVDAWRAVLSSLRERAINGLKVTVNPSPLSTTTLSSLEYSNNGATPFVRTGKPLAGTAPPSGLLWAGYRTLTDDQIKNLAMAIIAEIKLRGAKDSAPSLTLGEFVNHRLDTPLQLQSLAGLLQTAINNSNVNAAAIAAGNSNSKSVSAAAISAIRKQGVQTPAALDGQSAEGTPVMLTQGDLMATLAPIATVRGDTFKIRSYGEATGSNGTTVLARAWCETIVQRVPDFVDSKDPPETALASATTTNKTFGRRFNIVSFRWLSESEL